MNKTLNAIHHLERFTDFIIDLHALIQLNRITATADI